MHKAISTFITIIPALLITLVMMSGGKMPKTKIDMLAFAAAYLFFNSMFFMMLYTKKIDRYRCAIYISTAFLFIISFIGHMLEARGSMSFTDDALLNCEIPFCHIVTTMTIIPYAFTKTIIFPGSLFEGYASIGSMLVIWLLAVFTIGRGWCGWGCFFGGLDDGFSRIIRKPLIKEVSPKWKYLSFAVLFIVVLSSAYLLQPTYCVWLCPFKAVTEYAPVTSMESLIKVIIFISLFILLVMFFPLITKKRTQCAFFCPFGAMQSAANYAAPFTVYIDRDKCVNCKLCIKNCPVLALTESNLKNGFAGITCIRCGRCMDICPKTAISFQVKGTADKFPFISHILSLYAFYLFMAIFLGGIFINGVSRILNITVKCFL